MLRSYGVDLGTCCTLMVWIWELATLIRCGFGNFLRSFGVNLGFNPPIEIEKSILDFPFVASFNRKWKLHSVACMDPFC